MEDAKVIVTGAHGFLGRHVARLFSYKGYTVFGIGHGEWARSEWERWGLTDWKCSDVNSNALEELNVTASIIVHCAGGGLVSFSTDHPIADFERTVATTAHLLEYVRQAAPKCRVVYPSSASVYGATPTIPIREDFPAAPISQYGVHKLMAEQMVASYARQFGTLAAVVRLFSVYGCGLRKQLLWDACAKFENNDTTFMGTGEELRDWLHVEDAAELIFMASEHAGSECPIVNGGSGEGISVCALLMHLRSCFPVEVPAPSFSGVQRTGDPSRYVADVTISRSWGWVPERKWEEGVQEYVSWWSREAR